MSKVELLWLWYDYYTELYDQQLRNIPSPNDEGSVIVIGHHQSLSNKHAYSLNRTMYAIADYYGLPRELMHEEKVYRCRQTTKRRMELFEWIKDNRSHDLKFIDEYNEMTERELQMKIKNSGIHTLQKHDAFKF